MSSQISWDAIVRALETSQRDAQRTRRLLELGWWLLLGALSCVFGWLLYTSVKDLDNAWLTGDPVQWDMFWRVAVATLALSPLAIPSRVLALGALTRPPQDALAIRQDILDDKVDSAPIAAEQPLVLPEILIGRQQDIGPLARPQAGERDAALTKATILIVGSLVLAPFSLVLVILPVTGVASRVAGLGFVAVTLALALSGMRALRTSRELSQDLRVLVDEHGLRWPRLAARHRFLEIPWSQARAFVTLHFQRPVDVYPRDLFILDSPSAVLAWEITNRSKPEERAAHEYLSRLIAAHAHLPLRDLISTVESRLSPEKDESKPALTFPLPPPGSSPVQAVELPITIVERNDLAARAARRSMRLGFALTAVFILPVVVLYGVGWGLQQYQPQFYAGLVARVHAEKPLFRDALAQDDGNWWVAEPSASNNYERYFYAGGAYHLVGKRTNWFMESWDFNAYAEDAAVEVTVSAGHVTDDDGVGLLMHTFTAASDFEVFMVDTRGYWHLWDSHYVGGTTGYAWNEIAGDYTSAAHQGAGARNRLLAIQRGSQFLLYVNDHFVGSYSDPAAPQYGRMGVYVDWSTTEGIFSDFTVYPAPSMLLSSV